MVPIIWAIQKSFSFIEVKKIYDGILLHHAKQEQYKQNLHTLIY